jgi:transcriptional regulator with XRE-family HTH domain
MEIKTEFTDELILQEIGERLARTRLARNFTQAQLANMAGISKRTLERLELGASSTQLTTFIRICRALGLLPQFDSFVTQPVASPIEQVKLQGQKRKRASGTRVEKASRKKWTWGESS